MSESTTHRHPHHDIIIAWLEGKEIEVLNVHSNQWEPLYSIQARWDYSKTVPAFSTNSQFRIKPEPKTLTYRVALMKHRDGTYYTVTKDISNTVPLYDSEYDPATAKAFIQWVSEPITYTLSE